MPSLAAALHWKATRSCALRRYRKLLRRSFASLRAQTHPLCALRRYVQSSCGGFALETRDRFRDLELRCAVVPVAVQENERIVHVLLQRHVAHHAHRTEAFSSAERD